MVTGTKVLVYKSVNIYEHRDQRLSIYRNAHNRHKSLQYKHLRLARGLIGRMSILVNNSK